MKKSISVFLLLTIQLLMANVSLPYIFSDNMVLQRNSKIPVWGFASPHEKVSVSFKNQTKSTVADQNGNWKVNLDQEKEGGPFTLTIKGNNEIVFKNVLVGDVWLCSGQSNMEWALSSSEGYKEELNQKEFPLIRHIKIERKINSLPQNNLAKTEWNVANASTIGDFSAVAYFFAKKMYHERQVPIGIINSSWGGTVIEAWIPKNAFEQSPYFKEMIANMPQIDIESLQQKNFEAKTAFFEKKLNAKIADFNQEQFLSADYNASALKDLYVPKAWEQQGFEGLDGVAWVRKTIVLSDEDLAGNAVLYLGKIDDEDLTYFNGKLVGQMKQWSDDRIYTIPKEILKKGENIIAVKVNDTGGGGGLWNNDDEVKLVTAQKSIPLAGNWKFAVEKIYAAINQNEFPSLIYNAMIHPIEDFRISGMLWYQGESNAERAYEYNQSFPLLINSWRQKFGENLPFYFVQLATFNTKGDSNEGCDWCEVRDAQLNTTKMKNTGMVVTTDVGNPNDIHPRNKKTVGERLANLALNNGLKSPIYQKSTVKGNKITISFNTKEKLISKNNEILKGFEIAGNDQKFYPAKAEIKKNKIVVTCEKVSNPVAVRYGWKGDDSEINLFTEKGLPVAPFRTDSFKLSTENKKYQFELK